ncbi:uncharacterized protein LOC125230714 isoform X2 [Leguminivora glycinivorella]|uniref:uncharacterized protein LOC125230714 isoform X2 n=1 Tax=Leguminivora glycinivorella TaxID=1035111 RepID=UPI00200E7B99|nr:uncharacterized protein LOC125230714 isoform X2 [Leguminivora glycinivorella]
MIIFLVFMTVLATAYADCDACIQGICHSKKTLIEGFNITGHQLAIDRANNIVYVHINFQTIAFFLDEAKMRKVDSERTVGLAVDQNTQMLYSDIGRPTPPAKLRHEANTLYIINADGTSAFLDRTSNSITGYHNLENFPVTDMVTVMNESAWFFTADNQLYRYNWDANGNKMFMLLVFATSLAAAHGNCDACIQELCYSKHTLIEGFAITDRQLAIDRNTNILYVHVEKQTIAFFLNESKIRSIDTEDTAGLAVDQDNQVLYSGQLKNYSIIYTYKYKEGAGYIKRKFLYYGRPTYPVRLRYEDTLYMINADGSCAYFNKTASSITGYANLENFVVTDMVSVLKNETQWYYSSEGKLYNFNKASDSWKTWDLISDKKHALSVGKFGDVYLADDSEKVIYKLDRETKAKKKYGAYMNVSLEDFVFDSEENIVYLDHNGYVARWVSTNEACKEPHIS